MKRKVLNREISSLLLGELSEKEACSLKERLLEQDGNLNRIDRLKEEDDSFLARFPAGVFAAQVESKLNKDERHLEKFTSKKREHKMIIGKRVLIGVAILGAVSVYANHLHTTLNNEVSFNSSKNSVSNKEVKPVVLTRNFQTDFANIQKMVQENAPPYDESVDRFVTFFNHYKLEENPDLMFWAYEKYAVLLDRGIDEDLPSGATIRAKIVKDYRNMSDDLKASVGEVGKDAIAKSIFLGTEKDFLKMTSTSIGADSKSMREKQTHMMALSKSLREVRALKVPRWTVAANYRSAAIKVDIADSVRRSAPKNMPIEKAAEVAKTLENSAMGGEIVAMNLLRDGLAIKTSDGHYAAESRILLERLKAKICPTEKEMEALHASIWEVEHGSLVSARKEIEKIGDRMGVHISDVFPFSKKLKTGVKQIEIRSDAESLRMKMDEWACLSKEMHDEFHQRIDEKPYLPEGKTHEDVMRENGEREKMESGKGSKADGDILGQAVALFVSGDTDAAIEKCVDNIKGQSEKVKMGCYALLSQAYTKLGDVDHSCKYQRLAGRPVSDPKCTDGSKVDDEKNNK